ncbi:MAG: hypothetical protein ABEH38_09635 [Flavobacteriales bacterium]
MKLPFSISRFFFFAVVPFLLVGCTPSSSERSNTSDDQGETASGTSSEAASDKEENEWYVGAPFRHDSLEKVFFPVRKVRGRSRSRNYFSSSDQEGEERTVSYASFKGLEKSGHFLNMVLWDPATDQHSLLRDSLFHMTRLRYWPMLGHDRPGFMLYRLITKDRNDDGKYRPQDGVALFYSLPDGSEWRRLTPTGYRVEQVHVLKQEGVILIRTLKGSGEEERTHHLSSSLNDPQMAEPFFASSFRKKLKQTITGSE